MWKGSWNKCSYIGHECLGLRIKIGGYEGYGGMGFVQGPTMKWAVG
jgi:hypothetical protein